jgi:hypothetical protein
MDKYQELILRDRIRNNKITFRKGDKILLLRKKSNGYPKTLSLDKEYIVEYIIGEKIGLINDEGREYSCNKTFFTRKGDLRDSYLERILKNL